MIFFKTWQRIFQGKKTHTRRPKKNVDEAIRDENGRIIAIKRNKRFWLRLGDGSVEWPNKQLQKSVKRGNINHRADQPSYAIQATRTGAEIGRFRILEIREELIQDISDEDIIAEGVEHEDVEHLEQPLLNRFLRSRFIALWDSMYWKSKFKWENNPEVWVIVFEPLQYTIKPGYNPPT